MIVDYLVKLGSYFSIVGHTILETLNAPFGSFPFLETFLDVFEKGIFGDVVDSSIVGKVVNGVLDVISYGVSWLTTGTPLVWLRYLCCYLFDIKIVNVLTNEYIYAPHLVSNLHVLLVSIPLLCLVPLAIRIAKMIKG